MPTKAFPFMFTNITLKGMEWDVTLKSINAGMPSSSKNLYSFRAENRYLIRPFDVFIQMQTVDRFTSDMTVDVSIQPALIGELDALKLARLLFISRLMTVTFAGQQFASPAAVDSLGGKFAQPSAADWARVSMLVRVKVAEVALNLAYEIGSATESIVLSVKTLDIKYFNRPLDANVLVDLTSLSIENSSRSESQRFLARTPAIRRNLIHFAYTFIRDARSPVYLHHASEVLVNFANLALNVDAATVLCLRPFVQVLLAKDKYSQQSFASLNESQAMARALAKDGRSQLIAGPQGMRITLTLTMISLDLLRNAAEGCNQTEGLENAFSLRIEGLEAGIELTELVKAEVKMRSMDVFDKRPISRDYFYTNLFSMSLPSELKEEEEEGQSHRVSILYEQHSRSYSSCAIVIPRVSSFLSLDAVLDLTSVSVDNAFAFLALNAGDDIAEDIPAQGLSRESISKESIAMNVTVDIVRPTLILLDDPTMENCKAIVCQCYLGNNYARQLTGVGESGNFETKESLLVTMKHLEIFVLKNLVHWEPQQILCPMVIEFNLRRRLERGIVITCDMSLDVGEVDLRVSVRDFFLAQSILTRRTLSIQPEGQGGSHLEANEIHQRTGLRVGGTLAQVDFNTVSGDIYMLIRVCLGCCLQLLRKL